LTDISERVSDFVALNPLAFSVLKTLAITQGDSSGGVYEQRVSVVLAKDVDDDSELLHVEFYGVRNFVFAQPDFSVVSVHLDILDGSTVPGRGCVFFVRDIEQEEMVCFECREFEAYTA
jgi:hypothetical protein